MNLHGLTTKGQRKKTGTSALAKNFARKLQISLTVDFPGAHASQFGQCFT